MEVTLPNNVPHALSHIPINTLTLELGALHEAVMGLVERIPSPSTAAGHAQREEAVDRTLGDIISALSRFASRLGLQQDAVLAFLGAVKPRVRTLLVAVGDTNEKFPCLFPTIALTIAVLLLPESSILRPILSTLGFGPRGPIKRGIAARVQSTLYGGAVPAGGIFAGLQAAGMGVVPIWLSIAAKAPLITGGVAGVFMFTKRAPAT